MRVNRASFGRVKRRKIAKRLRTLNGANVYG